MLFEERDVVPGEHQRVAPARAGVLHRGGIAPRETPVFELDDDRDRFARLTDARKPRRDRLADVGEAVVPGAALDRALVVEEESGESG